MSGPVKKFGIAVLGLGRMGMTHARSVLLNRRAQLRWVVRRDVDAARQFAAALDSPVRCATPGQLDLVLQDDSVDGLVISTPTSEHEPVIKAALDAGKAIFSEKPITADIDSTRECYDKSERLGLPILCAFHRRFDPSFVAVKSSLEEGDCGPLRMVRCSSHDSHPPPPEYIRSSGGIFKDSTIHDFDMAQWMSASPATKIYVQGGAHNPDVRAAGDLDLVVATIEHGSGSVSVIDNGRRCAHGYDQRFEALCENGSFVVTNRPTNQLTRHSISSTTSPPIDSSFITRYPEAYENEMEHFLDVLEGSAAPRVTKWDTLAAMRLAEAALQSALTGRPVDL